MTAIVRLLLSLLFGTILLFRLDRNVMMPGFQFADFGQIIVASQHIHRVYYIKWNASKLDWHCRCQSPPLSVTARCPKLRDYWSVCGEGMGRGGLPEVSVIPRCPLLRGIRASTLPVHIQSCVYNYTTVGVLCRCNHTKSTSHVLAVWRQMACGCIVCILYIHQATLNKNAYQWHQVV